MAESTTDTYTAAQKLACIERELKLRKQVYKNRVLTGRMSQALARHEMAVLMAIANDYRLLAQREQLL